MSRNDYYNASRAEILKRLKYIQEGNIVDFFKESASFELAIYLAYFTLAEEMLVERSTSDINISTRFKKSISSRRLEELFTNLNLISINRDQDGKKIIEELFSDDNCSLGGDYSDSNPDLYRLWFLSTLRNGIIHNGPIVSYKDRVINVLNTGKANKLDCDVSFDWFRQFILDDFLLDITLDEYNYTAFIAPYKDNYSIESISNFDDVRTFIDEDLLSYSIRIKHDSGEEITRSEFLKFCFDKEVIFWKYLYDRESLDKEKINELKLYEDVVTTTLGIQSNISKKEYRRRFNYGMFTSWFKLDFQKKFPGYRLEISEFKRENPNYSMVVNGLSKSEVEKRIFGSYKNTQEFFRSNITSQFGMIASGLNRVVNRDKVDYITSMQYLFSIYDMHKGCIDNGLGISKYMKRLHSNTRRTSFKKVEHDYIEEIKRRFKNKGIKETYDKQITSDLISTMDRYEDDIMIRCRELCDGLDDIYSDENIKRVYDILKQEFPLYFEEESKRRESEGYLSDQILELNVENDLCRLNNARGVFQVDKDKIIVALLYALGINTYVVNKENTFSEKLDVADYDFMDELDIVGYSSDQYEIEVKPYLKQKSEKNSKLKRLNKQLSGNPSIVSTQQNINSVMTEITLLDNKINRIPRKEFNGVRMGKLNNNQCATTIRNCLSHCGRIFIDRKTKTGEIRIVLTDYNENGNLSGVVETNLDSLIKFFSHSTFYNTINKNTTDEVVDEIINQMENGKLENEEVKAHSM